LAENPLLPHHKLQELYTLMRTCRTLEAKQRPARTREAILAGTTIHLAPGDFVSAPPADPALALAPALASGASTHDGFTPSISRWLTFAAISRGLHFGNASHIGLLHAHAGDRDADWQQALTWLQTDRLPAVVCVADIPSSRKHPANALTWPAVDTLCRKLHLPTLTVDGEDAVALYRVMQEASHRARTGLGPSVIWAVLSPQAPVGSALPLTRLKRYMAQRSIPLPA